MIIDRLFGNNSSKHKHGTSVTKTVHGTSILNNDIAPRSENDIIDLSGEFRGNNEIIGISNNVLKTHMLCFGMTQQGKTNVIMECARQLRRQMTNRDVMVIFDTKQDYVSELGCDDGDVIIGANNFTHPELLKFNKNFRSWNVFREVMQNGKGIKSLMTSAQEICHGLFSNNKSVNMPYFANAARSLTVAYLAAAILINKKEHTLDNLDNSVFVDDLSNAGVELFENVAKVHRRLRAVKQIVGDGQGNDVRGVLSEIATMINDCFCGNFGEVGDFSFGEFVRNAGGHTLFVEYDVSIGETLLPMYKTFFDIILKEALGSNSTGGNVYVILDELRLLPRLSHLNDALNFGASRGLKLICGCQSVAQLEEAYGRSGKYTAIAGFGSLISFHPNDDDSRNYVKNTLGRNVYTELVNKRGKIQSELKDGYVVEDWDLEALTLGQAIIKLNSQKPFMFKFDKYDS